MVCPNYCGVTCVNGTCPVALGECHITCDECPYYKGCEDCAFCNDLDQCETGYKRKRE